MSAEESQLNVQGYNIVTILKRLETATSRLEDITMLQEESNRMKSKEKKSIDDEPKAMPAIKQADADASEPAKSEPEEEEKAKSTVRFEEFIESQVTPFVEHSKSIDPVVGEIAAQLYEAFKAQAQFLDVVSKAKKPDMTDPKFMEAVKPTNEKIEAIGSIKDANRTSKFFNHLNTVAEGAPVLGWIVSDTPVSLIPEFKDSAQFWSNRILKEYKDKDQAQVDWVKKFLGIFDPLKDYVKEFHTKGPKWNNNGRPLADILSSGSSAKPVSAPSAPGGAPPPPPPPPPPSNIFEETENGGSKQEPASGMQAVFADINRGEGITSSLKKVEKSQMTHKNPELRKAAPPSAPKKPTPPKKPSSLSSSGASQPAKKPAKKELVDGSKWIIENFTKADLKGEQLLTIEADMHHSIFVGSCEGITIQVKGKANAISLSNTTGCGIIVDSLISGLEVIKSLKFGLQILGTVADVSIDQSDEVNIYLSQQSIDGDTQIYTSSTTALNINIPKDDDYVELAAPEQFKHSIKDGKLASEVLEHVA